MNSEPAGSPGTAAVATVGQRSVTAALLVATTLAELGRRVARALAPWRDGAWATPRVRRQRRDNWETAAAERYLRGASDVHDLERRQRTWDGDEVSAYRMSGWL